MRMNGRKTINLRIFMVDLMNMRVEPSRVQRPVRYIESEIFNHSTEYDLANKYSDRGHRLNI